ncbi:hypothetical protein I316_00076 [Kwoniella heveanensis BCC8398]|uniref:Secreted protein n=1 Tax=Kwoniella heveanensis BCC8398 TaxID=1296120 RepID=A0A1B9H3K0_9TREE|nr:hypothetical protein I316_00076 [Kwoniella heveanensis BCC8398]
MKFSYTLAAAAFAAVVSADSFANFFSDENCNVDGSIGFDMHNDGCFSQLNRKSVYIPNTGLINDQFCLVSTHDDQSCSCQSQAFDFTATGFCATLDPTVQSYRFIHTSDLWAHLRMKAPTGSIAQTDLRNLTTASSASRLIATDMGRSETHRRWDLDKQSIATSLYTKYAQQIEWQNLRSAGRAAGTTEPSVEGVKSDVEPPKKAQLTGEKMRCELEELIPELSGLNTDAG